MVRKERLELSHLAAPEPKSGASTNSATSATQYLYVKRVIKVQHHINVEIDGRATLDSNLTRHQKPLDLQWLLRDSNCCRRRVYPLL